LKFSPIFSGLMLSVANVLDAITTYLALTKPNITELNPFMRDVIARSWIHFFSVKLCASVLFVLAGVFITFIIRKYNVSEKVSKICALILLLGAIGLFCASLNNLFLYIGWERW